MSWNLYVGADVDAVIQALSSSDPSDDVPALLNAIQTLQETDFPTRAGAIADHIAASDPDVIGLQEVSTLDIDLSALGYPVALHVDFLPILQAELAARGLNYTVAALHPNLTATPAPGISLTDQEALLVNADRVTVTSSLGALYSSNIGPVAPGVSLTRGYVVIEATIGGRGYTIASTHLESGAAPGLDVLRAAQATELMTVLGTASPAIVLGDLNDGPASPMHQVVTGAGFTDVWAALRPGPAGYTCCHTANLADQPPTKELDQRIDYVMARGLAQPGPGIFGNIQLIGDQPSDRLAGPVHTIWPSDHVGVAAHLRLPVAAGLAP